MIRLAAMSTLLMISISPMATAAADDAPWFDPAWHWRSRIEVITPPLDSGLNVARAFVDTASKPRADGADLRMTDSHGAPVGFHVFAQFTERTFGIEFEVSANSTTYYCYFGNPDAAPESRPWPQVRGGLTVTSFEGTSGRPSPVTLQEFKSIVHGRRKTGFGRRSHIDDDENPVGPTESYFLIYDGFFYAPADGEYGFATNSDDASFVEINGQETVSWGGGHAAEFVDHPMLNTWHRRATRRLARGVHRIRYYMQNWTGTGLARAGWKPPGALYEELLSALQAGLLSFEVTPSFNNGFNVIPPEAFIETLLAAQRTRQPSGQPAEELFYAEPLAQIAFNHNLRILYAYRLSPPAGITQDASSGSNTPAEGHLRWILDGGARTLREPRPVFFFDKTGPQQVTLSMPGRDVTQEIIVEPGPRRDQHFRWHVSSQRPVYYSSDDISLDIWLENHARGMTFSLLITGENPDADTAPVHLHQKEVILKSGARQALSVPIIAAGSPSPPWKLCRIQLLLGGRPVDERRVWLLTPSSAPVEAEFFDRTLQTSDGTMVILRCEPSATTASNDRRSQSISAIALLGFAPHADGASRLNVHSALRDALRSRGVQAEILAPQEPPQRIWRLKDLILLSTRFIAPPGTITVLCMDPVDALEGVNREDWERMLAFTIDSLRRHGPVLTVLPPPVPYKDLACAELSLLSQRASFERGVTSVDLVAVFRQKKDWEEMYRVNGLLTARPQEAGIRLLAESIADALLRIR